MKNGQLRIETKAEKSNVQGEERGRGEQEEIRKQVKGRSRQQRQADTGWLAGDGATDLHTSRHPRQGAQRLMKRLSSL